MDWGGWIGPMARPMRYVGLKDNRSAYMIDLPQSNII